MTVIAEVMARSYSFTMFDDLTSVPHVRTFDKPSGVTTLTFADDLPPEVEAAIRDRMTSKNDVDQAKRAVLKADRDALAEGDPLRRLYGYVLGE